MKIAKRLAFERAPMRVSRTGERRPRKCHHDNSLRRPCLIVVWCLVPNRSQGIGWGTRRPTGDAGMVAAETTMRSCLVVCFLKSLQETRDRADEIWATYQSCLHLKWGGKKLNLSLAKSEPAPKIEIIETFVRKTS